MRHKVLFVDDEPHITDALKRALRKEPYEILTASSAQQAFEILARQPVDIVVSDEMMPGMSGSEFVAAVRQKYPDTIRMILTGHASLDAVIRSINQGEIYRFFTKPCNEVDLSVTIRQALQQKDLVAETQRLLKVARQQSNLLHDLEKSHPGITQVETDDSGAILIDEEPNLDFDSLLEEIEFELKRFQTRANNR